MRIGERHGRPASTEISDGWERPTSEQLHTPSRLAHCISPLTSKASNLLGRKAHVNLVIPRLGFFKLEAQVDLT
jgi:hypothetical protein